ncbi:STAS domain-containing protein [Roseiflexus sp.]|uniref:STAS domain-containing protein n=1 Tax=Roseiflexus sp. TaxID=2562120 RepID=UPI00398A6E4C
MASLAHTTHQRSFGQRLSLRARLILGYAVVISLTLVFGLITVFHLRSMRDRIETLSTDVPADVRYSIETLQSLTETQRWVERYLQQPTDANYREATRQLGILQQTIERLQTRAHNPAMQEHLQRIANQAVVYRQIFDDTHTNLTTQQRTRDELYATFLLQYQTIEQSISNARPASSSDDLALTDLSRASTHLQLAYVWIGRMQGNDTAIASDNALAELRQARTFLQRYLVFRSNQRVVQPEDIEQLQIVSDSLERSIRSVISLSSSHFRIEALINTRLKPHTTQMFREAIALSDTALMSLSIASADINKDTAQTQIVSGGVLVAVLVVGLALGVVLASFIVRPLNDLVLATTRLARGADNTRIQPRGGRELVLLAQAFNDMAAELERERAEVRHQNALLAERAAELEQTLQQLREETAAREQLSATVRQLSVPIMPIMEGVLVAPLVGEIDAERARLLQQRLLDRIVAERARVAILDITGVPVVDAQISTWLVQATTAARLLGARCILVGINPEVSQALVSSGADLGDLATRATLREGLEYAIALKNSFRSNHSLTARR